MHNLSGNSVFSTATRYIFGNSYFIAVITIDDLLNIKVLEFYDDPSNSIEVLCIKRIR